MKDRDCSQYDVVGEASEVARKRDDLLFVTEIARESLLMMLKYSDPITQAECRDRAKWCNSVAKRTIKRAIERAIDNGLI